MTKRMLIDASHPEETRLVVLDGSRIEEFDVEAADRRALKGNIYLAKIVRVEPSLQAAFVEYGGNRHGFLAFGEIHPDYYQIPVADRQRLLEMYAREVEAEEDDDDEELDTAAERLAPDDDRDLAPRGERDSSPRGERGTTPRGGRDAATGGERDSAPRADRDSPPRDGERGNRRGGRRGRDRGGRDARLATPARDEAEADESSTDLGVPAAPDLPGGDGAPPFDAPADASPEEGAMSGPAVANPDPDADGPASAADPHADDELPAPDAAPPSGAGGPVATGPEASQTDASRRPGDTGPPAASGPAGGDAPAAPPLTDTPITPEAAPHAVPEDPAAPAPRAQPMTMHVDRVGEGDAVREPAALPAEDGDASDASPAEDGDDAPMGGEVPAAEAPETVGGDDGDENGAASGGREREDRRSAQRFMRHYKIQEVIRRRQVILVQVVKEERGNKGAALTSYISLAGRFSVLMPNSPRGGGVSRKITQAGDRKRLREAVQEMDLPRGMSIIVRTAGAQRPKPEIKRDGEYLMRLWDDIRERTFASTAPALVYEEADLIKRSIRDVYGREVDDIEVEGEAAWEQARAFMRMIMPGHEKRIRLHRDPAVPLFAKTGVEAQLDAMMHPTVQLKSGGYIVINQTEALVAIDVNSGRSTRDRHIEDTALRTNCEAAEEIARQLRLRDLAGLIVIDFIDMEASRNDAMVEKKLKDALRFDRARIQVGRISHFGLMEMSRQRLRPSLGEHAFSTCAVCQGRGIVRSLESSALHVLRAIEEEGGKRRAAEVTVYAAGAVAMHILNRKRARLAAIEERHGMAVLLCPDAALGEAAVRIERTRAQAAPPAALAPAPALRMDYAHEAEPEPAPVPVARRPEPPAPVVADEDDATPAAVAATVDAAEGAAAAGTEGEDGRRRRRRRRGGRRADGTADAGAEDDAGTEESGAEAAEAGSEAGAASAAGRAVAAVEADSPPAVGGADAAAPDPDEAGERRRGRRGGRRRREGVEAIEVREAPPPRYAGPTPADPFGGLGGDVFDAMAAAEAAHEAALAAASSPSPERPSVEAAAAEAPVPADAPELDVAPSAEAPETGFGVAAAAPEPPVAEAMPPGAASFQVAPAGSDGVPATSAAAEPIAALPEPAPTRAAETGGDVAAGAAAGPSAATAEPSVTTAEPSVAAVPSAEPLPAGSAASEPSVPAVDGPVVGPKVVPVVLDGSVEAPPRRGWWKR